MNSPNYISHHFQKVHYPSSSIRDFRAAEGLNGGQVGDPVKLVNVTETEYMYKYNGQEWQDELGLNMYAMDMRQYDPAIARWVVQDPVIHHDYSPYSAFDNNPVFWADPSGADAESRLKDIFNRSQDGDVWTNDGSGTLTNNRNGETSECDDCEAKDGPLKGQKLSKMVGTNFEGSEIIPWQGKHTIGVNLEFDEFLERTEFLQNKFDLLAEMISLAGFAVNSFGVSELKRLGIKGAIKSPTTRVLLLTLINTYLQQESGQLTESSKTLVTVLRNYIRLSDGKSNVYEISILYNGYYGLDDYIQKSFYTSDGQFLGGWKRMSYKTEQQLPTITK